MKKLILIFFILFFLSFTKADGTYCEGWEEGYKAGYCYEVVGCVEPVAPVCPVAKPGFESYQDGYNRGFTKGKEAQNE